MGVVGVGSLGYHHVRILRDLDGVEFIGFHEARPERSQQVSSELGVRAFDRLEDLLGMVEAITVVVPTPVHHAVAAAALDRGIHVLVEKPITATLDEADDLLERAARAGAIMQTGHVERFNRAIRAAMPYVREPRFIESDRLAPFNPRGSEVAVVLDLMIHDIDLILTLVGGHVTDVAAAGVGVLTPSVDIANARLTFDGGAIANITASRVSRERMRKIRIFQPSGYLSLDLAQGQGEYYRLRADVNLASLAAAPQELEAFLERIVLEAPVGEPLRLEFESFVAAVRGKGPVVVTGEDGREALEVALRIVRDIEARLPVLTGMSRA